MAAEKTKIGDTAEGHHRYEVRVNHKVQGVILAIMELVAEGSDRLRFKHYVLERDYGKDSPQIFTDIQEAIFECAKRNGRIIKEKPEKKKKR